MAFRNLDGNHDWTWGSSKNNYVLNTQEIALNVKTRVLSFLNDCFFAINEGIDYWSLLDYNKQDELENKIQSTIIQTPGVVQVNVIDLTITANRTFKILYEIEDVFGNTLNDSLPINV